VGHGLGVKPEMIIIKNKIVLQQIGIVYHKSLGAANII
jgi:hypothetical protein